MTSAAESFVVALGRASRRSHKVLRGMTQHDRDDVVSTALLACWEHRESYNPAQSLDDWFMQALKNARRGFKRGDFVTVSEFNTEMAVPDDTSARAEAIQAAEEMQVHTSEREQEILKDLHDGFSWRDIMKRHRASGTEVGALTRKLKKWRELIPEPRELQRVLRASTMEPENREPASIDRALARMELPQQLGKECPPCWRCKYFDGFTPVSYAPRVTTPADMVVQQAIWRTEQAKIDIANRR